MDASSPHIVLPIAVAGFLLALSLYNFYKLSNGPLAHLPGPVLTKYTGFLNTIHTIRGNRLYYLKDLHDQYGPIVRISPGEASVADLQSHSEIHKIGGGYLKTDFYTKFVPGPIYTMFAATEPSVHSKWRRLLGNSMSESVLKSFDGVVNSKVELLISQTQKDFRQKGYVDVYQWMHFFATDIIGELAFGDSFRMLDLGKPNKYIEDVQKATTYGVLTSSITGMSQSQLPDLPIWPITEIKRRRLRMVGYANQSIDRYERYRDLNPDEPKPMFFDKVMSGKGKAAELSREEIVAQANGFIIAGTDTTAVTATYLVWLICQNPSAKSKLLDAIKDLPERPSNDDLRAIPYLDHLIDETLRLYGAAPAPLPRAVPAGGRTLAGHFVPASATVSPVAYVLHRDQKIFPNPEMWIPERWENATKAMRDASYAFGGGSRVCIGMHLAKMELRCAITAFFKQFPNAKMAYGVEGFTEEDMKPKDFFIIKPQGQRCLIN